MVTTKHHDRHQASTSLPVGETQDVIAAENEKVHNARDDSNDSNENHESTKNGMEISSLSRPGTKVLARDTDGLLYTAWIRRAIYGKSHQLQLGILDSLDDAEEEKAKGQSSSSGNNSSYADGVSDGDNNWYFFCHFDGWKVQWDRWIPYKDILEYTPENVLLKTKIQHEHRRLLKTHKEQQKQKGKQSKDHTSTISCAAGDFGGNFLKAWKGRLESILHDNEASKGSSNSVKSNGEADSDNGRLKREAQRQGQRRVKKKAKKDDIASRLAAEAIMRRQHFLTNVNTIANQKNKDSDTEAYQIVIPASLQRILVEDWEILTGSFGMVHRFESPTESISSPLPTSVYGILQDYLHSKGVGGTNERTARDAESTTKDQSDTDGKDNMAIGKIPNEADGDNSDERLEYKNTMSSSRREKSATEKVEEDNQRKHKEWNDMADGICQLFDQALPFRLLYPCEQAQLNVLVTNHKQQRRPEAIKNTNGQEMKIISTVTKTAMGTTTPFRPCYIYGGSHLLRLFVQLPQLLAEQYGMGKHDEDKRNDLSTDLQSRQEEEDQQQHLKQLLIKPMLAKLHDLLRFLQAHQGKYFPQQFQKGNEGMIKIQAKWLQQYERRR